MQDIEVAMLKVVQKTGGFLEETFACPIEVNGGQEGGLTWGITFVSSKIWSSTVEDELKYVPEP
jgi:hypothetical protein